MAGARETALQGLIAFRRQGAWPDLLMKKTAQDLRREDAALASVLLYGTLQNLSLLDFYLQSVSSMPMKKVMPQVLDALRLGAYQLLMLDRIPDSAAVNETVKLVKKQGGARAGGYANAVLHKLISLRDQNALPPVTGHTPQHRLATQYSHPLWFVEEMWARLGPEGCEALLAANNQPVSRITLRVNTLKTTAEGLISALKREGVDAAPAEGLPDALETAGLGNPAALDSFQKGLFYVQDAASQLCVAALDPQPGTTVIDMCAAPGGKTLLCAQRMRNQGSIVAIDIHPHKAKLIEENAARYGADIIQTVTADASHRINRLCASADSVLCDVPCSGFGILRKKPDIRFKKKKDLQSLSEIQKDLLMTAAHYVRPGGRLVYSTCTVRQAENEDVVRHLLAQRADYQLLQMKTMWPHIDGTDGFFYAQIQRR